MTEAWLPELQQEPEGGERLDNGGVHSGGQRKLLLRDSELRGTEISWVCVCVRRKPLQARSSLSDKMVPWAASASPLVSP